MEESASERLNVIQGGDSVQNAHITYAYPFGSNRCIRREWIEQGLKGAGKGQYRFGYQTTDRPFNYEYTDRIERDGQEASDKWALERVSSDSVRWNAPKMGTYNALAVMVERPLDDGSGRIGVSHVVLNTYDGPESFATFKLQVSDQLDDRAQKTVLFLEKVSRHFSPTHWAEYDEKQLAIAGPATEMELGREREESGMEMAL